MTRSPGNTLRFILVFAAVVLALVSVFFVFHTARLLVVTHGLRSIRAGRRGAYAGAVVFPAIALLSGWGAWRCWRGRRGSVKATET